MNVTAKISRTVVQVISCVAAVAMTACTGTVSRGVDAPDVAAVDALDTRATVGEVSGHSNLEAVTLLGEEDGLGIELVKGAGMNRLIISTAGPETEYTATRLENPARIVVDVHERGWGINRMLESDGSEMISRIRIGSHPDKNRIVLDLVEGQEPAQDITTEDGRLLITLSNPSYRQDDLGESQTTSAGLDGATEEGSDMRAQPDVSALLASESDSADAAGDDTLRPTLDGLSIESFGDGNKLIADLSSAGFFTLQRTAPSEYILQLEDASLGVAANDAVIAPPDSGAIRSVRATTEGDDVVLRIFVSPATLLKATPQGGKLIVAAYTGGEESLPTEIMAQAAVEDTAVEDTVADNGGVKAVVEPAKEAAAGTDDDDEFAALLGSAQTYKGRQISLDLQDTDIDNALRIIAEVSNLNIIASGDVTGKVTLRLIDVPWDQALDVILKTNGLDKVQEGNVVRIAPVEKLRQEREALRQARDAEEELEPMQVMYRRVSYARAAELKPLVETVISERGVVSYDERTNQLILRDIRRGIKNGLQLVSKLDLRTPQVLLETQIVEAQRKLMRDLGAELGFSYIQSPETGNPTGHNFPNSVAIGGGLGDGGASSFPAAVTRVAGSAVSLLFDSADGTKSLGMRISALEEEGRVRVVSRPAVVTTNNQPASIRAVEKIRVKTPDGGLSVATGQGASASGTSAVATETIEVGIVLEVTPQASPDYYVLLDIRAKSSNFGSQVVEGIPSEVERSANSSVLVSSGQTFVMGGIYKLVDRDSLSGVPFLKDVPVIGHLFRKMRVDNRDEELLFFITPRIVEGSFDDAAMEVAS